MNTISATHSIQATCDKPAFFEDLLRRPSATHVIVSVNDRPYEYTVQDFIHSFLPRFNDYFIYVKNDYIRVDGWALVESHA